MLMPDLVQPANAEVRCPGGLLGIVQDGLFEVKCRHWRCNQGNQVTFHLIDVNTGKIVDTYSYKDPSNEEKK
jgi:hypothetical protein